VSGDTARIYHRPDCDVCRHTYGRLTLALYDGKTKHGPWAYMCQEHFDLLGVGRGPLGQLLIVDDEKEEETVNGSDTTDARSTP
jgi:hypothetical protein